jgi:hypothetical protein
MRNSTARFARYLQRWWEAQLQDEGYPADWQHGRNADALASEFRRDAQFELVQARFLHHRPDQSSALMVVGQLVPVPDEDDTSLLATAIVRAGLTAQRVRTTGVVGASLTVCALVLRNILRRR